MGLSEIVGRNLLISNYQLLHHNQQNIQEAMFQKYYAQLGNLQQTKAVCIHPNCPVCEKQQEKFVEQKKLAYKNRCQDYMKKFRRKFKCQN